MGAGIDPAIADRIFESLFTTKPNGMGMGLSICRSIIEAHGGALLDVAEHAARRHLSVHNTRRRKRAANAKAGATRFVAMGVSGRTLGSDATEQGLVRQPLHAFARPAPRARPSSPMAGVPHPEARPLLRAG